MATGSDPWSLSIWQKMKPSTDTQVCRRYDIRVNKTCSEIPFFSVDGELVNFYSGRVYRMCGDLGAGGGSIRYRYSPPHWLIFDSSHVTVYPTVLHQVKVWLPGKKHIPAKINGKISIHHKQTDATKSTTLLCICSRGNFWTSYLCLLFFILYIFNNLTSLFYTFSFVLRLLLLLSLAGN